MLEENYGPQGSSIPSQNPEIQGPGSAASTIQSDFNSLELPTHPDVQKQDSVDKLESNTM
jgi:hypothetical protein